MVNKGKAVVAKQEGGRTMGSLRGLAQAGDTGVRRVDSYRADPLLLVIEEGFNVRVARDPELRAHIDAFKESIKLYITKDDPENRKCVGGLREVFAPIDVAVQDDGALLVTEGHSRTIAIRELIAEGWEIAEVDVTGHKLDDKGRVIMMVRSSQGKNLAPVEKAEAFRRLADEHGMSVRAISDSVGKTVTPQRVEQLLLLGRAPAEIRQWVEDRVVTADSAIEMIREHKENAVEVLRALVDQKVGSRPVGKGQTRVSIPTKVQQNLMGALRANKGLSKTLKTLAKEEGWEEQLVDVQLPAGVLHEMLERQRQAEAKAKAKEAGAEGEA